MHLQLGQPLEGCKQTLWNCNTRVVDRNHRSSFLKQQRQQQRHCPGFHDRFRSLIDETMTVSVSGGLLEPGTSSKSESCQITTTTERLFI